MMIIKPERTQRIYDMYRKHR